MKKIISSSILVFSLFLLSACVYGNNQDEKKEITQLLTEWKKRDGSKVAKLSFELSKKFVATDSLFFEAMIENQDVFDSWIDNIQYGTFTVFQAQDEIENLLYEAFLQKLKELMLDRNQKYVHHSKYKEMATRLKIKLEAIHIRFID